MTSLRVGSCAIKPWNDAMKIVPALLAEKSEDLFLRMKQAEAFADYVQIDMMDGVFVPTRSFPPEEVKNIQTGISFEVHLMVNDPWSYMDHINHPRLRQVIFHYEAKLPDALDFIRCLKRRSLRAGLAVNPETPLEKFQKTAEYADTVLFLTVTPGRYGSPFKPEVLGKIAQTRTLFPGKTIAVDGGVSLDNLNEFMEIGVDYVCIGSRIFLRGDPKDNYRQFLKKVDELERKETR
jgi:ribulose-phosphate 3-epimerase